MIEIKPTAIKTIFQPANLPKFHSLLNLWAIEDDALTGLDLQFSSCYELILPDLMNKEESELEGFFQSMKNFLHSLPENVTLQFLVQCRTGNDEMIRKYQEAIAPENELAKFLVKSKVDHLRKLSIQRRRYFMFVTTYPDNLDLAKLKVSPFKLIQTKFPKIMDEMHKKRIASLNQISRLAVSALKSAGVQVTQLDVSEIVHFLYGYINPSRIEFLDPKAISSDQTLRSQIIFNACKPGFDSVTLDGFYFRAINLHTRPSKVHFTQLQEMMSYITPDYDLCVTLHTGRQESFIKQLQQSSTLAKVIAKASVFKRYYEAEQKAQACDDLIRHVKETFQKLYNISLCLVIRENSLGRLTTKVNEAVEKFRVMGEAEAVIDDMNHLPLFLSVLPNHSHLNMRKFIMQTEAAAQLLPLSAPWTGSKEPKLIFQTEDSQLFPLDLFDPELPAKHAFAAGSTGSGKSFAINYLLMNFFLQSEKNHIVIIEPGPSYRKLAGLFSGQYLEIELSEKYAINPFQPKDSAIINPDPQNFEVDGDVLTFLTLLVQKMLKIAQLSGREQVILEHAITNAYKYSKTDPPILSSLHYQLQHFEGDDNDKKIANEFAKNLDIWVHGRFGKLVNRENSIKTDNRLVVFDLRKLDDQPELQSIVFFLIKNVIYSKLKDLSLRKMIVIDEGWKFFSDEVGNRLIQDLYRVARKYGGAIYSISQMLEDFLKTPAAGAIVGSSYLFYILKLNKGHDLLPQFKLNEPEIDSIKNLTTQSGNYSEIFLKFNDKMRIIRIEPSSVDYWICTTDKNDTKVEDYVRETNPGFTEVQIIEALSKLSMDERKAILKKVEERK